MPRSTPFRRALAAVAALASSLAVAPSAAQAAPPDHAPPAADTVDAEVREDLADDGEVHVVVMLDGHRSGADVAALRANADTAQDTALAGLDRAGITNVAPFATVPAFTATITSEEGLDRLARRPGVRTVSVDAPMSASQAAEPLVTESIRVDDLHDLGFTGEGVTIAVADSGVDADHPDLADALVQEACFSPLRLRFCPGGWRDRGTTFAEGPGSADDNDGHGTAASGVAVGRGAVGELGMAPDADLVAIRVFDQCPEICPFGTSSAVLRAGDWIVDNNDRLGVDVVSLSMGGFVDYEGTDCDGADAVADAGHALAANLRASGILPVAAAGNEGAEDRIYMPACLSNVVSVGTVTQHGSVTYNSGPGLDVLAPHWTLHAEPGGGARRMRGTSSSTPVVAGCAAVLNEVAPDASPERIEEAIVSSGRPVDRNGATYPALDCAAAARDLDPTIEGDAPPTIEADVSGEQGAEGWYTGDVTVSWDVSSATPVTGTEGCDDTTVTTDTTGLELTCSATNANGTRTETVTVRRDATPPTVAVTVANSPVPVGGVVDLAVEATDATAGVDGSICGAWDTRAPGTFTLECFAQDRAGNLGTGTATYEVVGDGDGDGDGDVACVTAPNTEHVASGRAVTFWGSAYARGTGDRLGRNTSSTVTSLRQVDTNSWERVDAC